tara:strand:+ start:1486 stop:2013 length:528 start_codon:yes stop_codon:yes gene_type:complete
MSKYILIVSISLNFCFGQVTLSPDEIIQYYDHITNLENKIEELNNQHQKDIDELELVIKQLFDVKKLVLKENPKFKEDDIETSENDAESKVTTTKNKINEFEKDISNLESEINKKTSEKKDIEAKKKLSVDFQKELESLIVEWNKKFQALKNARVDKNNFEKKIEKKLKQEPNKK